MASTMSVSAMDLSCPIDETVQERKETLKTALEHLWHKVQRITYVKRTSDETAQHIKVQAQQTEKQIKKEFENLHQFLRDEEAARIAALREEEEQRSQMMKEKIEEVTADISYLSHVIRAIKEEMKADDVTFLQSFKSTLERAHCILQDPEEPPGGALIDVAKHLGNLKFRVWEKMQEIVQYTPVILDPNTAHQELILSEDLTSVKYGDEIQRLPDDPGRFEMNECVVCSEGFNSGTHCWDVEVTDRGNWCLGLLTESAGRNEEGSHWSGYWCIYYSTGNYEACCPDTEDIPITVEQRPQRIRMKLDWDRGQLTFTDPDLNKHLHTVTHAFTERMFPCFHAYGDGSLRVLPVKPAVMVEQFS